jgi:hypothetical protein
MCFHIPVTVVVKFVVRRKSDQTSPGSRQREENLSGSIFPHLGSKSKEESRSLKETDLGREVSYAQSHIIFPEERWSGTK